MDYLKQGLYVFAGIWISAFLIPTLFLYSCQPEQLTTPNTEPDSTIISIEVESAEPPYDPCYIDPQKFDVRLCIDDNENVTWYGLWDECFNLGCETAWEPALGLICFRCVYPICEEGFRWTNVEHLCNVPDPYSFEVDAVYEGFGTFWEACITFEPDECLAETFPNCYDFRIYAANCPY